ncbi:MAG TPA: glycosyltransferase [Rhizobiaceae bacterium]|nr:glycosyltransferase [Rhizobiaceae bacterium]
MTRPLDIVFIGLTLSSSWGNGHATTYRALLGGLDALGHRVAFLERDVPWYADSRDLVEPDFCELVYYRSVDELRRFRPRIRSADAVVIGSYVPDGRRVIDCVAGMEPSLLAFYDIDTPVTLAGLERGEDKFIAAEQVPLFDLYLSFSGGKSLLRLEEDFGARRARPLYCSVDSGSYAPTGEAFAWDLGYLGTYSEDRQPALERLLIEPARRLPERRFVVAGSCFPDGIEWPDNIERIEHLPPEEHASFYSRQRFTLNVTRSDMVEAGWSPSVRLFEAASCGTPIISDRWDGLDALFPDGEAILISDGGQEVVRALTGMSDKEREAMAVMARRRVLAHHTGQKRAEELIGYFREIGERPRPAAGKPALKGAFA